METVVRESGVAAASAALVDRVSAAAPEEEPDAAAAASPYCMSLLRAACRNVASPERRPAGGVSMATTDVITSGPRRTRPVAARLTASFSGVNMAMADADAFFEYDLECGVGVCPGTAGAASLASHPGCGEAGGADTGCALTTPVDDGSSRELSSDASPTLQVDALRPGPVQLDTRISADSAVVGVGTASSTPTATNDLTNHLIADAADGPNCAQHSCAAPSAGGDGDCLPSETFYQANSRRHGYENPLEAAAAAPVAVATPVAVSAAAPVAASAPVAVPAGRRHLLRRGVAEVFPPSPSEKVDAWLRSWDSADADAVTGDELAACFGPDRAASANCAEDTDPAAAAEGDDTDLEEESLTDADELDIQELLTKGCEMLEITSDATASRAGEDAEQQSAAHLLDGRQAAAADAPDEIDLVGEEKGVEVTEEVIEEEATDDDELTVDEDEQAASLSYESSDFQSPNRYKRASSLKSSKRSPLPPGQKKIVRFADSLGLDLQQVRIFSQEVPSVSRAALAGLQLDETLLCGSPDVPSPLMIRPLGRRSYPSGLPTGRRLVPLFLQPSTGRGFQERLRRCRVAVVSVTCHEDDWSVRCLVSVLNMDFHKSVCARHTLDEWRTWSEVPATYVQGSSDGFSDKFQLALKCDSLTAGRRLHFAVAFRCQGQEFWDNNGGNNYTVLCAATRESTFEEWNHGAILGGY